MKSLRNYLPCAAIGGLLLFGTFLQGSPTIPHTYSRQTLQGDSEDDGFFIIRTKWVRAPHSVAQSPGENRFVDHVLSRYGQ